MKKMIFFIVLIVNTFSLISLHGQSNVRTISKTNVKFSGSVWDEKTAYIFTGADFLFDVYHKQKSGKVLVRFKTRFRRFRDGFLHPFFAGRAMIGLPERVWSLKQNENSTITNATFPLIIKGKDIGRFSIRVVQLKQYPDWMFFRMRGVPMPVTQGKTAGRRPSGQLSAFYLGIAARSQPLLKTPLSMYLAWPDGSASYGDKIPWNKRKPNFNGLGIYIKGGKEEAKSDFIVFNPAQIANIGLIRWRKNDRVTVLSFRVAHVSECFFAIGAVQGKDDEKEAIPQFMKKERTKIFNILQKIDWEPTLNKTKLQKYLREIAEILKESPNTTAQAHYKKLKISVNEAIIANDINKCIKLESELSKLNKKLSEAALKEIL